jgi:PhoH-like ATPase
LSNRKLLVIDTSVMLYDPNSLTVFRGNDVIIPLIVLEELDRFKERKEQIGSSAREVNRFLDSLRKLGSLHDGVAVPDKDVTIRVVQVNVSQDDAPAEFPIEKGDNKIIAVALTLKERNPDREVRVITKDINLRVKCDALGMRAEDYYSDIPQSFREGSPSYSGQAQITVANRDVDMFYQEGEVSLIETEGLLENQLVVGQSDIDPQKSILGIYSA